MHPDNFEEMEACQGQAGAFPQKTATCDQEAWLKARLATLVRTVLAIQQEKRVRADSDTVNAAINGAIKGTALEVLYVLDIQPAYENLPKRGEFEGWMLAR